MFHIVGPCLPALDPSFAFTWQAAHCLNPVSPRALSADASLMAIGSAVGAATAATGAAASGIGSS